jgi:RNA polymerase sigma-70 factor (ECF subfamily)
VTCWEVPQRSTSNSGASDERALVQQAQRGEVEAFTVLVYRHQDRIYRLALRVVGPDAAEDVAQQAFLKAWQGLAQFQGASAFGTWLYRMAVNLCLDHLRRVGRFRPLPLDDVAPVVAGECDVAELVESTLEQNARREALAWALERLSSEDRLLLHLRVAEELSYEAIAELLGANAVTVGTRLYRARARLHGLVMQRLEEGGCGLR